MAFNYSCKRTFARTSGRTSQQAGISCVSLANSPIEGKELWSIHCYSWRILAHLPPDHVRMLLLPDKTVRSDGISYGNDNQNCLSPQKCDEFDFSVRCHRSCWNYLLILRGALKTLDEHSVGRKQDSWFHLRIAVYPSPVVGFPVKTSLVNWRSLLVAVLSVVFLSALVDMAESTGSFASSPDPVEELAADIKVLKRRVRKQGDCLRQMDVMGGRRLSQLEEDIGRLRTESHEAMKNLEAGVQQALAKMDLRLQTLEQKWAKRKNVGSAGSINPGAEVTRR